MDFLTRVRERLAAINDRLSTGQKVAIAVLVALLVAAVSALSWAVTRQEMRPIYTNLEPEAAGGIIEELEAQQIPYEVGAGGGTVLVPEDRVAELRMKLASKGLGRGSSGYDWFDKHEAFGVPSDILKLQKKRALEGELSRSVASLESVRNARIHLAKTDKSLFVNEDKPPRASVFIELYDGKVLSKQQVKGIVNLVAFAVPRLDLENVTVVDQRGKVLNRATGDSIDGGTSLEYTQAGENEREMKAREMLERVVGPGKAIVKVTAKIDFSQEHRTEELYDAETVVPRSEETLSEVRENGGNRVGGAAGAAANDPNVAQGVIRVGDASNSTREKTITNNEIPRTTKQVKATTPTVTRLSVSVLVDGTYEAPTPKGGEEAPEGEAVPKSEYVPRTAAEMKKLEKMVASAIEFDVNRGDQLEVTNLRFASEPIGEAEDAFQETWKQRLLRQLPWALVALVAIIILFLLLRPVVRYVTEPPEAAEVLAEGELPPGEVAALPGEEELAELEAKEPSTMEKIKEFAAANPEHTAAIMRFWLREREEEEKKAA